jgi:endonuclease YncB( thermonuclease family)
MNITESSLQRRGLIERVPPKAVCWVGDSDVTHLLLSQGWAELADEVTEASYVEALASAQSKKAGIWGAGPP